MFQMKEQQQKNPKESSSFEIMITTDCQEKMW